MQTYALYCIYDGVEEGGNDDEDAYPVYKYTYPVYAVCECPMMRTHIQCISTHIQYMQYAVCKCPAIRY